MSRSERRREERQHRKKLGSDAGDVTASWVPNSHDLKALLPDDCPAAFDYREGIGLVGYVGSLKAILSIDEAGGRKWFHVSVSKASGPPRVLPTWGELALARETFFKPDAVVVQIFPPAEEWYSIGEVLHLWQRIGPGRLVPDMRKMGGL